MSSLFVRQTFYAALPILLPTLTYYPTLNVPQVDEPDEGAPDRWYTIDFEALDESRVSIGMPGCFVERGVVVVTLAERAGFGDLDLAEMAQTVHDAFLDWHDPTGHLRVVQVDPPIEVDGGDLHGAWWLMEVPMGYEWHRH
jgi:hypothetical protein